MAKFDPGRQLTDENPRFVPRSLGGEAYLWGPTGEANTHATSQ